MTEAKEEPVLTRQNFDLPAFMGTWYEQMRSKSIKAEKEYVQENYGLNPDNSVNVLMTQVDETNDKMSEVTGKLRMNGPNGKIKFFWFLPEANYQVVATDYSSYALIYSETRFCCLWTFKGAWLMTRERFPSEQQVAKAYEILLQKVPTLQGTEFHVTRHGDDTRYLTKEELAKKIQKN